MEEQIKKAILILKKGGIVAFPTDTVYGLGANALDEAAVTRIFIAKDRPRDLSLPVLLSDVSQIEDVAIDIPDIAWRLSERFLPGGLTLVLQRSPLVPDIVTGGSDRIAVRVPAHPVPIALVNGLGSPIIGTSANLSSKPNPVTAEEVQRQMGNRIDFIIDGGKCRGDVASTVLDITAERPKIVREGVISREEIEKACDTATLANKGGL
jgi:L-threonylcarbamoyladenylate synthase